MNFDDQLIRNRMRDDSLERLVVWFWGAVGGFLIGTVGCFLSVNGGFLALFADPLAGPDPFLFDPFLSV